MFQTNPKIAATSCIFFERTLVWFQCALQSPFDVNQCFFNYAPINMQFYIQDFFVLWRLRMILKFLYFYGFRTRSTAKTDMQNNMETWWTLQILSNCGNRKYFLRFVGGFFLEKKSQSWEKKTNVEMGSQICIPQNSASQWKKSWSCCCMFFNKCCLIASCGFMHFWHSNLQSQFP